MDRVTASAVARHLSSSGRTPAAILGAGLTLLVTVSAVGPLAAGAASCASCVDPGDTLGPFGLAASALAAALGLAGGALSAAGQYIDSTFGRGRPPSADDRYAELESRLAEMETHLRETERRAYDARAGVTVLNHWLDKRTGEWPSLPREVTGNNPDNVPPSMQPPPPWKSNTASSTEGREPEK